jgi:hypothetical protein
MHRWRDDGILESKLGGVRGVFVERDVFAGTLERLEEKLGFPLDDIIIDAKRRDAKIYVDDILSGLLGRLTRFPLFRRMGYLVMIRQAATIGLAKAELLEYKTGKKFVGRAPVLYHPALFVGDVTGAFESIEGKRGMPHFGYIGKAWYIEIYPAEGGKEEERLEFERTPEVPARTVYHTCEACGVPLHISNFKWVVKEAKIFDMVTGEWVIYIDVDGVNVLLRKLEEEIGEEIPEFVARHSYNHYRKLKSEHPGSYLEDLAFIAARGYGVPEDVDPSREKLEEGIEVRNAFNPPIVAGLVAAVCGGEDAEFSWEVPEPGIVKVVVKG